MIFFQFLCVDLINHPNFFLLRFFFCFYLLEIKFFFLIFYLFQNPLFQNKINQMKLILFLSFLSLCVLCQKPLKLSQAAQMNQMIPSTSIPTIHPEDNWMFGSLAAPLPRIYNSPITHSYEEMLSNPKKRLISLGVNNSGTIDLNKSIIIDAEPRYVFDDGVLGTLSPVHKPMRKLPLTEQYEEMLKDTQKKLISLGVNSSAFYDPDNQVIMQGTENVNPLNVLGKSLADMQEENKKTKKKMASFLEDSPRFEQKNENMV